MSKNKKWSSVDGIQLLNTCIEWTISSVLSKKGSLCEMLMYKGMTPLDAINVLKGPLRFIEVVNIVMFLSLILTANVATPPPMSSPILIVPGFFTASTSSIEKSRPAPFVDNHRFFSLPLRSKQSLQSSNDFCDFTLLMRHS
ncbi:hypothetical protein H5410_028727 [Solanum commersonii]|uniref:Uncharacterized protein n=1 Tax=Solanum commersonii TaxID=4109 RepID=A0A9J5Z2R3_SOLCO|nr:hypothetical protein H5410_028727 [Solanum commersonii]